MTRVLFERLGDSVQQVFEGAEIEPVNGGIQRGLNEVLRGMWAGLIRCMAIRLDAGSRRSTARRWRHAAAQTS
jgi:hypothetical protein